jgi:glutamate racemase
MQNRPIGILDSGLGGLTIWNEIVAQLPNESTVYIADSQNCPYGNKNQDQIYGLSKRLVEFLLGKSVKLIVVACNSITVTCLDKLRADFPQVPITGIVPVIKTAAFKTKNKKIGVLSTTRTTQSKYQKELIEKFASGCTVFTHGTDELVPLIEKGDLTGEEIDKILRSVLEKFQKEQIDTLALGCSHFPFLEKEIKKILGKDVLLMDSAGAIARQVKRVLEHNQSRAVKNDKPEYEFFTTGQEDSFKKVAKVLEKGVFIENIDRIQL